jgi:hypothetical protein
MAAFGGFGPLAEVKFLMEPEAKKAKRLERSSNTPMFITGTFLEGS